MANKRKPSNDPDSVVARMRLKQTYLPDKYPETPVSKPVEASEVKEEPLVEQFAKQHSSVIQNRNNWLLKKIEGYQKK